MATVGKLQPANPNSLLTIQDVSAWYRANPLPLGEIDTFFPLDEADSTTWKTISNIDFETNEAADPVNDEAPIPVAGREGFKTVMGEMTTMGKGREMTADTLKKFEKLKASFATLENSQNAQKLVDHYGKDLAFIRKAIEAQRVFLCWTLLSNACSIEFSATNSVYFQGITSMDYPVAAWQKDDVATSWVDPAALILDDIQSVVDAAKVEGRTYAEIKINDIWFGWVRKNTQIKNQTITLLASLTGAQTNPSLTDINAMLSNYFQFSIRFVVINEQIGRGQLNGTKLVANPFANGVAVFTVGTQVGRFEWYSLFILDTSVETVENYFIVGTKLWTDPNKMKNYTKAQAFPVVDSFADNFYLRINAVSW